MSTSRPKRWQDACAKADVAVSDLEAALQELVDLQAEYEEWKDNLPENLSSGSLAEKLEAVCDLPLQGALDEVQDMQGILSEADGTDLPQGFGRD